jgi:hypothetical protein
MQKDRTRLSSEEETALVNEVVSAGIARYSKREVERDNISFYNPGGTAEMFLVMEPFVPEWMKEFFLSRRE